MKDEQITELISLLKRADIALRAAWYICDNNGMEDTANKIAGDFLWLEKTCLQINDAETACNTLSEEADNDKVPPLYKIEKFSKEYYDWLDTLKAGDQVQINHPWEDKEVPGGRMELDVITKISFLRSGAKMIHTAAHSVFGGGTTSYKTLMPFERIKKGE